MIIITGAAGLIGSALLWALNERGCEDVILVDDLDHEEKEKNVASLAYERLVGIKEFREQLAAGEYNEAGVEAILHMGACSDTQETDWEYLADNNVAYTQEIIRWCVDREVRCIYASSAATYGMGEAGYSDDHDLFDQLKPLNLYGKSKLEVDVWARDAGYLEQVVGLRYFNVFGPNEGHKEHMRSVIAKKFSEVQAGEPLRLFRSYDKNYGDGDQERDFIYVKDAVAATLYFLDQMKLVGVYNVGTGTARTWNEVGQALFAALEQEPRIEYIDMPEQLREQYQYHTQADITKLKQAGYRASFTPLTVAIREYVQEYLMSDRHLGEA